MSALLERPAVVRVRAALTAAGSAAEVIALADTARTAQDAADSVGVELGAIVKSLVFAVDGRAVMALVAGDRRCDTAALARVLGLDGKVGRADADTVRDATGFTIGGVPPIAQHALARSLRRGHLSGAAAWSGRAAGLRSDPGSCQSPASPGIVRPPIISSGVPVVDALPGLTLRF